MRLVPAGTSTSLPLTVSLGMGNQRLELTAEFLDVGDVRAHRAVVEGADRRADASLGHVEDGVEIVLAAAPLDDPAGHLVDPARRLAARRALPAALLGVEPRDHHEHLGDRHRLRPDDDAGRARPGARALEPAALHPDADPARGPDAGPRP